MTTTNDTRHPAPLTIQARLYAVEELCLEAVIVYRDADLQRPETPLDPLAIALVEALLQARRATTEARHAYNKAHGL